MQNEDCRNKVQKSVEDNTSPSLSWMMQQDYGQDNAHNSLVAENSVEVQQVLAKFHNTSNNSPIVDAEVCSDAGNNQDKDKTVIEENTTNISRPNSLSIDIAKIDLVPPENFSSVVGGVYRSGLPRPENFPFLKKLGLRSILLLLPEPYSSEHINWMEENGIKLFQVGLSGNKEPFANIPAQLLTEALSVALDPSNQPLLIHCNRGKHRTGCVVGCIRKLQHWSLTMIFDEYRRFAFPKARALDQQCIELYDETEIQKYLDLNGLLPVPW
ncbi:hypothetical protein TBLA_0B07200 [Henningerozyma blattae CBS 6284]|uniref:diphosphoinositol-polyphosphate diphosphatase n=1 Tax=Henningerozyma blattae (strain ATCC 34711 / CBS 6284 / DSM 70876 / NBRC 10599 / NRRL Y-10934 / UCD 77-7) TaxID=1071380 RepID=I2GZI5_HENB6|nr:hypothetical protein TBLA_0B07200 [Tetrapisispora blattae CBS 6284]CCH59537.1 hypothetical protein TBLA_0B07200 [Tetrapisispora blattae CBS 6284]